MAPLVRTGGSRHTGLAALPHRNIHCEKNHEYIRYIRPKGSSFADLNDEKVRLMMNHINNEKRDSLNGHSPYELSLLLLDNKLHKALGLKAIAPDDVMLSPKLIK